MFLDDTGNGPRRFADRDNTNRIEGTVAPPSDRRTAGAGYSSALSCSHAPRGRGAVTLFVRANDELRVTVEQQLYAAYPDVRIVPVRPTDDLLRESQCSWVMDLRITPDLF